jgi:hypothetical protein
MSTKLKHQAQAPAAGGNVVAITSKCACEGCKKATDVQNFCKEHFDWFKFGLLTKEGKKPVDFDKKWTAYSKKSA